MPRSSIALCLVLLAGCGGSTDSSSDSQNLQKAGGACRSDRGCQTGLACVAGICTAQPGSGSDCPGGRDCPPAGCDGTNCPCDIIRQDCADATDRCYPSSDGSTAGQCYGAGGQGLGSTCSEPPVDAPAACGKGLLCAADATCHALCVDNAGCPSGQACQLERNGMTAAWGVCVSVTPPPPPSCDPLAQNCPAGQMCLVDPSGATSCVGAGSGTRGSGCMQSSDCAAGFACATLDGSTPSADYFSIDPVFLSRGGGTCMALCGPTGAACGAGGVCAFISGPGGDPLPSVGVCEGP